MDETQGQEDTASQEDDVESTQIYTSAPSDPGGSAAPSGFKQLLLENWLWLVAPIVLVLLALAAFLYWTEADAQSTNPFDYPIF